MSKEADFLLGLLLFLVIAAVLAWLFLSGRETAEARARRLEEESRQKQAVGAQRSELIDGPVPPDVSRFMRDYLRSGTFMGEERSPLDYVGYHAGKTHGLASWDRQRRIRICFRVEIPAELGEKYLGWGGPVTSRRYEAMRSHLIMLANTRRSLPNLRYAVADWESDEQWFRTEYGSFAEQLRKLGF